MFASGSDAWVEAAIAAGIPALQIDAERVAAREQTAAAILDWVGQQSAEGPLLVYSSADPEVVRKVQALLSREGAGHLIETLMGEVAQGLAARGFRRLLVAGGETSGAVVQALGAQALTIGPEIDPGVPWTRTVGEPDLALASA